VLAQDYQNRHHHNHHHHHYYYVTTTTTNVNIVVGRMLSVPDTRALKTAPPVTGKCVVLGETDVATIESSRL
jgi:hypothetical protein